MDTETKNANQEYRSQIFFDGDVLTADEMNNIITGIDECQKKVPNVPDVDGQYFLSADPSDSTTYKWIRSDPFTLYRDPDDDGNVIIGEDTSDTR